MRGSIVFGQGAAVEDLGADVGDFVEGVRVGEAEQDARGQAGADGGGLHLHRGDAVRDVRVFGVVVKAGQRTSTVVMRCATFAYSGLLSKPVSSGRAAWGRPRSS